MASTYKPPRRKMLAIPIFLGLGNRSRQISQIGTVRMAMSVTIFGTAAPKYHLPLSMHRPSIANMPQAFWMGRHWNTATRQTAAHHRKTIVPITGTDILTVGVGNIR